MRSAIGVYALIYIGDFLNLAIFTGFTKVSRYTCTLQCGSQIAYTCICRLECGWYGAVEVKSLLAMR